MPRRPRSHQDFDSPWKDALQAFFPAFVELLFPDIHVDIDWSRGYVSLDKEFQQILRHAKVGKRLADKLFKVWLRDGAEYWLLIHVEIQAEPEDEFPRRMFDYNSAVRKLYNQEVISLAVLCDDRPDWRPSSFGYGRWGCRMELTFRPAKLLDYLPTIAELEANRNPIAAIVVAQLSAIQTRRDPVARKQSKLRLVKALLQRKISKDNVRQLFRLIDWLMTLPADLEELFLADIHQFEEENKVEWLSSIERRGYKKGMDEGEEKGKREGLLEGVSFLLDSKFGAAGIRLSKKVRALKDLEELREFARFLKSAESIDEVREYLR
jgi:hypothetical protein